MMGPGFAAAALGPSILRLVIVILIIGAAIGIGIGLLF